MSANDKYYSIDTTSWKVHTTDVNTGTITRTTGGLKSYMPQLPLMHPALQSLTEWIFSRNHGDPCLLCNGKMVAIERMALTVKCVHPVRGEQNHSPWEIAKWLSALTPPAAPTNEPEEWGEYGL